ncbi:penicillin-binding protein 2 [Candidatus Haliotispira prima]|uniref:Penicillin-binding protein 2 n=1 Tax=Candidatus Haliotispira prima TaxID=3034016 RepID=A0ABY8MJ54_9SPIO|nr:penicillin-binding protein 2 [Candidatus Haliotispira prima]
MAQSKIDITELRYWIYIVILALFFLIWFVKLFSLQILQGATYASEAVQITERKERLSAKRGLIYYNDDRTPIVNNIDIFTVYLTPAHVPEGQLAKILDLLSPILDMSQGKLEGKIAARKNLLQPIELKDDVHIDVIKQIAERRERLPGISYTSHPERNLIDEGSIIHIVGYVGKISDYELEVLYNDQYQKDTSIGKTGIEQYYDTILRGYDGSRIQIVDAKGNMLDERIDPPKTGLSLTLSVDRKIQKLAEDALGDRVGSAIVLRPATGEILAMVSTPWYKLSDFDSSKRFQEVINDPRTPLINRTIQSQYPPASTFKLVTATAMLGERSFSPTEYIFDPGYWRLGNRLFRCWLRGGHGNENLVDAIADSCNVYFGVVGVRYVGEENITKYARKYGFGQLTEVDLPGEVNGFVPSQEWKYRTYNQIWTQGDTLNISIGQGFMLVTPLQVAVYTSAIVNKGLAYKPSLLKKIHNEYSREDGDSSISEPEILYDMQLDAGIFEQIMYGMRQTVVHGTARGSVYNGVVDVAAKTGTAEIGLSTNWHSWFTSFGPYETDDPLKRVVVVTQVEADPTAPKENYNWWAPRAADIIFRGIFADENYEEVWLNYKKRKVWYHPLMKVPENYREEQEVVAETTKPESL